MKIKHTPSPWWPTDYGIRDRGGYIAHIRSVQRYQGQDERYAHEVSQREADKLLIAAAPHLIWGSVLVVGLLTLLALRRPRAKTPPYSV